MKISLVAFILLLCLALSAGTIDYADFLYYDGQYSASILEYNRYLYLEAATPSDSLYAHSQVFYAYMKAGFYDEAALALGKSRLLQENPDQAQLMKAQLMLKKGEPKMARLICANAKTDTLKTLKGIAELYLGLPDEARQSFALRQVKNAELERIARDMKALPQKNPYLAATMAIVPGLGYAYTGKYQTAISAFALQAAIFASAWELSEQKLPITSLLVAFTGTGFYLGSIYGSISEAHKYNEHHRKTWLDGFIGEMAR